MKKLLIALLALASLANAEMYHRKLSYTASTPGYVGEAAALNMVFDYDRGTWVPMSGTAAGLGVQVSVSLTGTLDISPTVEIHKWVAPEYVGVSVTSWPADKLGVSITAVADGLTTNANLYVGGLPVSSSNGVPVTAPQSGSLPVRLTYAPDVTVASSALPTGAATSAAQGLLRGDLTTTTATQAGQALLRGDLTTTTATQANQTLAIAAANKLTWVAGACDSAKLYQTHYVVTATTGTVTFVLASPTAAGKTIRIKGFHSYVANGTTSGGAVVRQYARDSLTGVTVSVSSVFLPNAAASAAAQIEVDNDDNNLWGPCGWPMSTGALLQCNLSAAIAAGEWIFHVVWWEE